jgi:hypothetical protein
MAGLFNSTVLDVAIGLAFFYLLFAILCTAANEWLAAVTKARPKMLNEAITQLLKGQGTAEENSATALVREFYNHPLITKLKRGDQHPTYLSSENFATTLIDIISMGTEAAAATPSLRASVGALPNGEVKKVLSALLRRSGEDRESAHKAIEGWFNEAMDRATGWYKRRTLLWTVIVAVVLTIASNADTVNIARRLWTDPFLRSKVVAEAQNRAKKPPPTVEYPDKDDPTAPTVTEGNNVSPEERQLLNQVIGWQEKPWGDSMSVWLARLLGWMLTILAISLGAPFWFDMLNKLVNIRSAGKSPDEAAKTPGKKEMPPKDKVA